MNYLLFIVFGYLSGSVLFCYYLPLWLKKTDITENFDDRNPGAFNCISNAGFAIGFPALLCDLLKGAIPVYLACKYLDITNYTFTLVMIAPVIGHAFPVFRKFRGGKSITVTFGVLCGLLPFWQPLILLAVIYVFFSVIVRIYPHRCRSMLTFLCFGALSMVWIRAGAVSIGCAVNSLVVFLKHKFTPEICDESFCAKLPFFSHTFFSK